jgi:hypothetical protein
MHLITRAGQFGSVCFCSNIPSELRNQAAGGLERWTTAFVTDRFSQVIDLQAIDLVGSFRDSPQAMER